MSNFNCAHCGAPWIDESFGGYRAGCKHSMQEAMEPPKQKPDGYAVVMSTGLFVGIWKERETAEAVIKRGPYTKGEYIRPMIFMEEEK